MKLSRGILILLIVSMNNCLIAQNEIEGRWKTIDDESGKARSIVNLEIRNGKLEGVITNLFLSPEEEENPLCTECEGAFKNQPIRGMKIISDMKYDKEDQLWEKGEILDPENGTSYSCKIWLKDGELKVRGYVAFFYRTQTWLRVKE